MQAYGYTADRTGGISNDLNNLNVSEKNGKLFLLQL